MRAFLLIAVICWGPFLATAQPAEEWKKEKELPGNWISFRVDNLTNLYVVNASHQLQKLDAKGDSLAVYNDQPRYGVLGTIDVTNPLLVLLHYPDFNTVVWLDRYLKPVHSLDLRTAGVIAASSVATSFDGKVWVYDSWEHKLKKFSMKGELLLQTPDLRQVLGESIHPTTIEEGQQRVYCYDPLLGVYTFDYFGNYERRIPIMGWQSWNATNSSFTGIKDSLLQRYDLATGAVQSISVPSTCYSGTIFFNENGKFYCLRKGSPHQPGLLQIFSYNRRIPPQ